MKKKSNILTIMKKELMRFFGDRRMVLSIFLPGLLIYLIYSLMGDAMMSSFYDEDATYTVQVEEMPATVQAVIDLGELPFDMVTSEDPKAAVEAQELDLYNSICYTTILTFCFFPSCVRVITFFDEISHFAKAYELISDDLVVSV